MVLLKLHNNNITISHSSRMVDVASIFYLALMKYHSLTLVSLFGGTDVGFLLAPAEIWGT